MSDPVSHPEHYTANPSGIECIEITEHMDFCLGNAIKYIWRASLKGKAIEDLQKARWYLDRKIGLLVDERINENLEKHNLEWNEAIEEIKKKEGFRWGTNGLPQGKRDYIAPKMNPNGPGL